MAIVLNPKYEYEPLKRINSGGRLYVTPNGSSVPSVTTVLSATADKTALIAWRNRVGNAEADRISKESTNLGTLVHKHVENHILGISRPSGNNEIHIIARKMSDLIIEQGLKDVNEVWGMEANLYSPNLYAGTTDLVGVYRQRPSIMDHKTAKKMKKTEWLEDYFIQTCAYAIAHNELYGTDIKQGVLFMASREYEYSTFVIEGRDFEHYSNLWLERLDRYYTIMHSPVII